jgi:signal transduction histidine kinase
MYVTLKAKIWLPVLTIVLLFSFFTMFYFPIREGRILLNNYNNEVQNLASTVALGVKIALKEQNYEGIQTAMEFVKENSGFKFVNLIQIDTLWDNEHVHFNLRETVFIAYPVKSKYPTEMVSNDSILIKRAPIQAPLLSGDVQLGFSKEKINENMRKVRRTSLMASGGILIVGLILGLLMARNISLPVRALRDAALRVGQGDLNQTIKKFPKDEIGDLSKAFNQMIQDLSKARAQLLQANQKLSETNNLLGSTLDNLKSTQAQLIQSEKMASLGELTAGIAHEIQNPLNFVNNFSEVNSELIDEMQEEIKSGNYDEAAKLSLQIKDNQEKVNFHGKRADGIVKGMLLHSRSNSGVKEPTDLNALADEYLRLAYHGLRAKDKTFNATIKTEFDESIGNINIVPQDIGRMLLNLITNAFYAVSSAPALKSPEGGDPSAPKSPKGDFIYQPTVTVITKRKSPLGDLGAEVEIQIKDNGPGIPDDIKDKIFQPFFTTKPTGQGTGLGLSLSYDIVKAHGGELKVETKVGDGTTFIVQLPA